MLHFTSLLSEQMRINWKIETISRSVVMDLFISTAFNNSFIFAEDEMVGSAFYSENRD